MTINATSIDADIIEIEAGLANLKRARASISAGASGGLSAAQLESGAYRTLQARGIAVTEANGSMKSVESICAAIYAKYRAMNLSPTEWDHTRVERMTLKRDAERLAMGIA